MLRSFGRLDYDYGPRSLRGLRHIEIKEILDKSISKNKKKLRILDVGCGDQNLLNSLDSKNFILYGCDWIESNNKNKNVKFKAIDINKNGLRCWPNNFFDVITCSDVIEHLEAPAALLREISRCIKPDGTILISFPNSWNFMERFRYLLTANFRRYRSERKSAPWGHISFFTAEILESICDRAQLSIESIQAGGKTSHMAFAGFFSRVPSSLLLSYNVYVLLKPVN